LSGPILGANFDLFQFNWVTFGIGGEYYFIEPRLQGLVILNAQIVNQIPVITDAFDLDLKGDRPITAGVYLRHMPPDVLGGPVHLEAWYKAPVNQTKLMTYGLALVYRPQIYRFDVGCRILVERTNLRFNAAPRVQIPNPASVVPLQNWEVRMQWDLLAVQFLAYF